MTSPTRPVLSAIQLLSYGATLSSADDKGPSKTPAKYEIHRYLGPESIRYEVEQSLRRLGTDVIDLYQTHWQESTTPIEVTMETLQALQREGKIRAIGVSNVNVEQLKSYGSVTSAQEKFNLLDRSIVKNGLVDACVASRTSVLSYSTMEQGLLTGAMSPGRSFGDGDTRRTCAAARDHARPRGGAQCGTGRQSA